MKVTRADTLIEDVSWFATPDGLDAYIYINFTERYPTITGQGGCGDGTVFWLFFEDKAEKDHMLELKPETPEDQQYLQRSCYFMQSKDYLMVVLPRNLSDDCDFLDIYTKEKDHG